MGLLLVTLMLMSMNNDNDYIIVDDSKFNDNDSLMFINGNFRN